MARDSMPLEMAGSPAPVMMATRMEARDAIVSRIWISYAARSVMMALSAGRPAGKAAARRTSGLS
jgi:hypothetical protein